MSQKEQETEKLKRLNVSVDEELHTKIKIAAAKQKTTIAQFVIDAINEKLEEDK